ncbi:RNA polymerase sigma factor [Peribacillus frigoritolerans]|nr:RNA polymerase sigma factor [Peribacillus frigoritolerans]MDM5309364.1 RNA polymerase sigma factor [Peribacillus frigoritolerans]
MKKLSDDKQLIQEILNGSEAALEILIRKYYKQIFAFVYRNVNNKDLTYDLTQEIFIKMIKKIKSYSGKGPFKSWLYTLAINHCRDYWKSVDYKINSLQIDFPENLSNERNSVSYIFEKNQTREKLKSGIQELPNYQKEAVLLKYYHDFKIKDIAQLTGVNESTVKSRLKQGLQKLHKFFKRGEEIENGRVREK